jgi:hypothetical protein
VEKATENNLHLTGWELQVIKITVDKFQKVDQQVEIHEKYQA